jgi:SAM-dependent methyltransferase
MPPESGPLSSHAADLAAGGRFAFGENWSRFLGTVTPARVAEAESSLRDMLGVTTLDGRSFLDIGCGSGLFSLAARRLGARVYSFDYDPDSVGCAQALRRQYRPEDGEWTIEAGSILDSGYVGSLGTFDVVYSWGVLHHTGAMWAGVEQAFRPVRPGGLCLIALYNRQPLLTSWWRVVKRTYLRCPVPLRPAYVAPFFLYSALAGLASDLVRAEDPRRRYHGRGRRGMSMWFDMVDWVGGWPFEVATPAEVVGFAQRHGLTLVRQRTVGRRHGCNEFVLRRGD